MRINREWKKRQQFRKDTDDRKIKKDERETRGISEVDKDENIQ